MLLRGTAIVSLLTLLSRILGFVRDLLVARLLGASMYADAFFVAFRIPNLLRSFVAEGALTAAFVPVFSGSLAQGRSEAASTFRRVGGFLLAITIPLALIGVIWAANVLQLFAPGFARNAEKFDLGVTLTQLMMPYIICVSLVAMLNAALNALDIYGTSAWAQVVMNITLIAGALIAMFFSPPVAAVILAVSVLLGGVTQLIAQVPACKRSGLPFTPSLDIRHPDISALVKLMLPATVGASIYQVTIFIATLLASSLQEGSVSWLFYADRVAQFPVGIFSVALASVLLPTLSNASANKDGEQFRSTLSNSLRYTNFVILPMAGGIWALALPITRLLFERGAFSYHSSVMTSQALRALALGLWFTSCHSMVVRAFIARRDTITPTVIGLSTLCVNFISSIVLMGPIADAVNDPFLHTIARIQQLFLHVAPVTRSLGHTGLAAASSIAAATSFLFVVTLFSFKIGRFPWRPFALSAVKSLTSTAVMSALLLYLQQFITSPLTVCTVGVTAGVFCYTVLSLLLRSDEMKESVALATRLLARKH